MITSNSSGSSPCSVASTAMDSPLLYEQFADHQQQHQQLISHKNSPPTSSPSSRQQQQQQRSEGAGRQQQQQIDLGRGLAPIRIPSSGVVFGNAAPNHHHQQQQQHLGQQQQQQLLQQQQQHGQSNNNNNNNSSFSELISDINTPEISLDLQASLQVNKNDNR